MERRSVPSPWDELLRTAVRGARERHPATIGRSRGGLPASRSPGRDDRRAPGRSRARRAAPRGNRRRGQRQRQPGLAAVLAHQPGPHQQRRALARLQRDPPEHRRGCSLQLQRRPGLRPFGRHDPAQLLRPPDPRLRRVRVLDDAGVRRPLPSAGENIGWESGAGRAPPATSTARSWAAATTGPTSSTAATRRWVSGQTRAHRACCWTGSGSVQNVWMFSEEFAQVGSSSPPPPHRSPTPKPAKRATRRHPQRPPSLVPARRRRQQLRHPTATPLLIPAGSLPESLPAPPVGQYEGLFPNTIESVLEAFLSL